MNSNITTEYPLGLIIFCLALAFLYTFFLYRKNNKFTDISKFKIRLMAVLRFTAVFLISVLLLSPVIKYLNITIEKPIIIIAQDNSESLVFQKDENNLAEYQKQIEALSVKLSENYEPVFYSFGEKSEKLQSFDYKQKETNISDLIEEIQNTYFNKNVGALIIASDGIYNKGINPLYSTTDINFPVYTIGLGDTTVYPDFSISKVRNNKIAFLGNKFPIQVYVDAKKLKGKTSTLKVFNNNIQIYSEQISVTSNEETKIIDLEVEAKTLGVQRFVIQISSLPDEKNLLNNYKEVAIEILDSRQKILIVANSPHPDISAIRQSLEDNDNYEVTYTKIDDFKGSIDEYNLVILHQIPSATNSATSLLSEIVSKDIPVIFIVGAQSSFNNINSLDLGLKITHLNSAFDESQSVLNTNFSLFEIEEDFTELVSKFPPLVCPFGTYDVSANLNVLMYQKINSIKTDYPLIAFNSETQSFNAKSCYITGEGIWRWRIYNYIEYQNQDLFDEFINKIIQYMALRVNKDRFVVDVDKIIDENKNVIFDSEVYNESYELVNNNDVNLDITDSAGNVFSYILDKNNKKYTLNVGTFPVGDYVYSANTKLDDEVFTKKGTFSVVKINLEAENIIADHNLLNQLSEQNNGQFYYPTQIDSLLANIQTNKNIVPISFSDKQLTDVINLKWLFFLIVGLISLEWFFRKFFGSY